MKAIPHVALLIETSNTYCRELLRGIASHLRDHRHWSIYLPEHGRGSPVPDWLDQWKGDGIIARVENEHIAKAILDSGLPAVNVSSTDLLETVPVVTLDDQTSIQLIVEHLLERGFFCFAFCGNSRHLWSESRAQLFQQQIRSAEYECHFYDALGCKRPEYDTGDVRNIREKNGASWEQAQDQLAQWIRDLPKPIGILTSYDFRGQQVLDACLRANAEVPGQVAVASLGNDDVLCELTTPPLTSISTDAHRAGFLAAATLDRLMEGKSIEPRVTKVKPLSVQVRQSTGELAIVDPHIATALQLIRRHSRDGINVADLIAKIPISRRRFELNFKQFVGRTPHEEILRVKLEHAKSLIVNSNLPFTRVARCTGFSSASHLGEVFRREVGMSPSKYREQVLL